MGACRFFVSQKAPLKLDRVHASLARTPGGPSTPHQHSTPFAHPSARSCSPADANCRAWGPCCQRTVTGPGKEPHAISSLGAPVRSLGPRWGPCALTGPPASRPRAGPPSDRPLLPSVCSPCTRETRRTVPPSQRGGGNCGWERWPHTEPDQLRRGCLMVLRTQRWSEMKTF